MGGGSGDITAWQDNVRGITQGQLDLLGLIIRGKVVSVGWLDGGR